MIHPEQNKYIYIYNMIYIYDVFVLFFFPSSDFTSDFGAVISLCGSCPGPGLWGASLDADAAKRPVIFAECKSSCETQRFGRPEDQGDQSSGTLGEIYNFLWISSKTSSKTSSNQWDFRVFNYFWRFCCFQNHKMNIFTLPQHPRSWEDQRPLAAKLSHMPRCPRASRWRHWISQSGREGTQLSWIDWFT